MFRYWGQLCVSSTGKLSVQVPGPAVCILYWEVVCSGTGASCVYPLLGSCLNNWQFVATELDEQNFVFATKNVQQNGVSEMIQGGYM
jgi:23S rRNA A1618 N6-methylase RlmF